MSQVEINQLQKTFGQTHVIKGVDLAISEGEFVVFVGPSGCGKSTLLRLIAGLEEPSIGTISIGHRDVTQVPACDRKVAMVFQSYALYPHMTVEENIGFGLRMNGVKKDIVAQKTEAVAKILQLDHLLKRKPKQLSGGQKQRVAIGRSIVRDPQVFLFDEPLSNLDAELRVEMRHQIINLHKSMPHATMIYVTHDQMEAMTMADKIVVLRDGYIEQVGSPLELYNAPVNKFVAGFIGSPKMNFLATQLEKPGKLSSEIKLTSGQILRVPFDTEDLKKGASITLGYRPEHILISDQGGLAMKVKVAEHLGTTSYLYGAFAEHENFVIEGHSTNTLTTGDTVHFELDVEKIYLFDQSELALTKNSQTALVQDKK